MAQEKTLSARSSLIRQAGFTLIELLIAMMIAAVIAVMSYQAIQQSVTVKHQVDVSAEGFDGLQKVVWWLEQDLAQMAPRPIFDALGDRLPALRSQVGFGVEWTRFAAYPTPYGQAGLLRVGYVLEEGQLYRLTWPVLDRAPDTEAKRLLLLKDVEDFQLNFLNANQQWQTTWPDLEQPTTALPKMTEMKLLLKGWGEVRRLIPGVDGLPDVTTQTTGQE